MTTERSFILCLLLLLGVVGAVVPREIRAANLTGVALYACDGSGEPSGDFWHTSLDPSGHPIGFTRWVPSGARGMIQFANDPRIRPDGDISIELLPISHVVTLFWQYNLGQFPDHVALNLFFNGDNLNPGISAVVPLLTGFTLFTTNPRPTTLSLYSREVQNPGSLVYDDGTVSARLGTAYYFRSGANLDMWMWRPSDLINVDRVGLTRLAPDGMPDAVMVFELAVTLSRQANPAPAPGIGLGAVVPPLTARVGEDVWAPPGTTPLAPPDSGAQAGESSQGFSDATPGGLPTAVADRTPTPVPEATVGSAGAGATPVRTGDAAKRTPRPAGSPPRSGVATASPGESVSPRNVTPTPGKWGWLW